MLSLVLSRTHNNSFQELLSVHHRLSNNTVCEILMEDSFLTLKMMDTQTGIKETYKQLIYATYEAFNARDIDRVLALMEPDVAWPNGWEGGYVHGHEEVREYWIRQWRELDPKVRPVSMKSGADGSIEVEVHQIVADPKGNVRFEGSVIHTYYFENDKISRMVITDN